MYGKDSVISVAVIVEGFTSVTLELWLLAELEQSRLSTASALPTPTLPATGEWVSVTTQSFTKSGLWTLTDLVPGQYKILMTAKAGTGNLTLREQHAA
jgi:hypothetical protein